MKTEHRPIVTRGVVLFLGGLLVVVFLMCLGILPMGWFQLVAVTALGWANYLVRVVPQVSVSWSGIATAVACLIGIVWIGHATARWLNASAASTATPARQWPLRYTLVCATGVVLMFVSGIATVGVTHQTAWLARSDQPMFTFNGRANRVKCSANLSSIYKCAYLYANDHGGRFPDSLREILLAMDVSSECFVCPSAGTDKSPGQTPEEQAANLQPSHCDFVYHGRALTLETATADVVVACEPLANHGGAGMNVVFGDGHVDWIPAERAADVIRNGTKRN